MALYILARNFAKTQSIRNLPSRICAQNIFQTKVVNKSNEGYFVLLDHKTAWIADKSVQLGLIAAFPIALSFPNKLTDFFLITYACLHSHWSLSNVIVDYLRPLFGLERTLKFAFLTICFFVSIITYGNLMYFIYSDVGVSRAIRMLWSKQPK